MTGAAGGIGRQILEQLQGQGRVIGVVQDAAQQQEIERLVEHAIECDLADGTSVLKAIEELRSHVPHGIDGLILTAAIQPVGPLELVSRSDLERLFAVNVFGTMQLLTGLLPSLRQKKGRIVVFSSMAGRVAAPILGAYSGSKFALEGLCDTLRRELAQSGVTVTLIEPGGVDTPMANSQSTLVERLLARLDSESESLYGNLIRGYLGMATAGLRHASKPEAVARLVVGVAIGPGRPAARYAVGTDAKLLIMLSRWLPTRWLDGLLLKAVLGNKA